MKHYIYCDESGEASFTESTYCNYFVICLITIAESQFKKVNNIIGRFNAELINKGWAKSDEIKANSLHNIGHNDELPDIVKSNIYGDDYIKKLLNTVIGYCDVEVNYIILNKAKVINDQLKKAPYGIVYNYLTGKILFPVIANYIDSILTIDKRNKEIHTQKHFDGYIQTEILKKSLENNSNIQIEIKHEESHSNLGLQLVDFFSWSINRKYVADDDRFYNIFSKNIKIKIEWP